MWASVLVICAPRSAGGLTAPSFLSCIRRSILLPLTCDSHIDKVPRWEGAEAPPRDPLQCLRRLRSRHHRRSCRLLRLRDNLEILRWHLDWRHGSIAFYAQPLSAVRIANHRSVDRLIALSCGPFLRIGCALLEPSTDWMRVIQVHLRSSLGGWNRDIRTFHG